MLVLTCLLLGALLSRPAFGWRESLVRSATATGLLVVAVTILGSLFGALNPAYVVTCWSIANLFLVVALWVRRRAGGPVAPGVGVSGDGRTVAPGASSLDRWLPLTIVAGLLLLTFVLAVLSVPRVYDALVYHLPRVVYWMQNGSVAFFPTPEARQNFVSPFPGYLVLTLMELHGVDAPVLLVQWLAFGGTLVAISLVADELGASPAQRWTAVAVVATIPALALQAPTALTDDVNVLWFVIFVWAVLRGRRSLDSGWMVGAAGGLAVLSKATTYFFGLPFGLWWLAATLRRRRWMPVLTAGLLFLAVNAHHYWQSTRHYGGPLGSGSQVSYLNEGLGPTSVLCSIAKHAATHAALPVTERPVRWELFDPVNRAVERAVLAGHRTLGVDPASDNLPPGTRFSLGLDGPHPPVANSPQSSGAPLHALLVLAAGLALVGARRSVSGVEWAYAASALAGLLLFAVLFKWQPWLGRFHLSFFVLAGPLVAIHLLGRMGAIARAVVLVGLGGLTAFLVSVHQEHDVVTVWGAPRRDGLHIEAERVEELTARAGSYRRMGILTSAGAVEYPFLRFLLVENPGIELEPARPARSRYDAILWITQHGKPDPRRMERLEGRGFRPVVINPMGILLEPVGGGGGGGGDGGL